MRLTITCAALGMLALIGLAGSKPAGATDVDNYRWNHNRSDCRMVETRTTNRWGDDVTIRRLVCG